MRSKLMHTTVKSLTTARNCSLHHSWLLQQHHARASTTAHLRSTSDDSNTIRSRDGRHLGYAGYGHPNGFPMFAFHGFPASRLELSPLSTLAHKRNIRMIAIDRPGFGLSSYQPDRQITDWPADVKTVADALDIKRFAVLGLSGGGPYALACAHMLPKDMLYAVGIFSGAPPWWAGRQQMPWFAKVTAWCSVNIPGAFRFPTDGMVGLVRWLLMTRVGSQQLDKLLDAPLSKKASQDEKDIAISGASAEERRKRFMRLVFEGFAQGSRAMIQAARLLSADDWGFKFEDVMFEPITIWHGSKDYNSPIEMIRFMANRLPQAKLIELDDTHFTSGRRLGAALDVLNTNMTYGRSRPA